MLESLDKDLFIYFWYKIKLLIHLKSSLISKMQLFPVEIEKNLFQKS